MNKVKKVLLIIVVFLALLNCSNDDDITIIGKWKLVQVLADPGDGSGVFRGIESNKTIEFFNDETFSSNGDFCFMTSSTDIESAGTYSEFDNKIFVEACRNLAGTELSYRRQGKVLIISFFCFEACAQKFIKIN